MADSEMSPATLLDELASFDPRREVAATLRRLSETFAEVPDGKIAVTICGMLGIGRTTLYRYLAESDED